MLLLNFAHPLTDEQFSQVAGLVGATPEIRTIPVEANRAEPIGEVARALSEVAKLSPTEWQTKPLLINPPGLAPLALALIAELHGRCGYFPAILNIRPVPSSVPPRYEVAEIVNLEALRAEARTRRHSAST
jgi:hypothetical protein